jgi:hypothetical protein
MTITPRAIADPQSHGVARRLVGVPQSRLSVGDARGLRNGEPHAKGAFFMVLSLNPLARGRPLRIVSWLEVMEA